MHNTHCTLGGRGGDTYSITCQNRCATNLSYPGTSLTDSLFYTDLADTVGSTMGVANYSLYIYIVF